MLRVRRIDLAWVVRALVDPDHLESPEDGTVHYLKAIPERGNRVLRVVLNPQLPPRKVITLFFDRRLSRP